MNWRRHVSCFIEWRGVTSKRSIQSSGGEWHQKEDIATVFHQEEECVTGSASALLGWEEECFDRWVGVILAQITLCMYSDCVCACETWEERKTCDQFTKMTDSFIHFGMHSCLFLLIISSLLPLSLPNENCFTFVVDPLTNYEGYCRTGSALKYSIYKWLVDLHSFVVSTEQLSFLIEDGFYVLLIADMFGVSIRIVRRRMNELGLKSVPLIPPQQTPYAQYSAVADSAQQARPP